jgi:hypothetical protein
MKPDDTYLQLGLLYFRQWSESFANTNITLNCSNHRCSVTNCGPQIAGTYLAMHNITVGLYVDLK